MRTLQVFALCVVLTCVVVFYGKAEITHHLTCEVLNTHGTKYGEKYVNKDYLDTYGGVQFMIRGYTFDTEVGGAVTDTPISLTESILTTYKLTLSSYIDRGTSVEYFYNKSEGAPLMSNTVPGPGYRAKYSFVPVAHGDAGGVTGCLVTVALPENVREGRYTFTIYTPAGRLERKNFTVDVTPPTLAQVRMLASSEGGDCYAPKYRLLEDISPPYVLVSDDPTKRVRVNIHFTEGVAAKTLLNGGVSYIRNGVEFTAGNYGEGSFRLNLGYSGHSYSCRGEKDHNGAFLSACTGFRGTELRTDDLIGAYVTVAQFRISHFNDYPTHPKGVRYEFYIHPEKIMDRAGNTLHVVQ